MGLFSFLKKNKEKNAKSLAHGTVFTTRTKEGVLGDIGYNALQNKDYDTAEKSLFKALESKDINPMDRHFTYLSLIELFYKQRNTQPDAINKCIKYCKEDIEHLEEFMEAWKNDELKIGRNENDIRYPRIPSFQRLAIIYEKQGKIKEAIEICNMVLRYEKNNDYEKSDFEKRLTKLQKKYIP